MSFLRSVNVAPGEPLDVVFTCLHENCFTECRFVFSIIDIFWKQSSWLIFVNFLYIFVWYEKFYFINFLIRMFFLEYIYEKLDILLPKMLLWIMKVRKYKKKCHCNFLKYFSWSGTEIAKMGLATNGFTFCYLTITIIINKKITSYHLHITFISIKFSFLFSKINFPNRVSW